MTGAQTTPPPAEPAGFGGWLLLPALGTIVTSLIYLKGSADVLAVALGRHMAKAPGAMQAFVWGEAAVSVGMLAAWLFAGYAMVARRRFYPRLFRVLALASLAFTLADIAVSMMFGVAGTLDDGLTVARQVIVCAIWIPYMAESVRVRNTFVR